MMEFGYTPIETLEKHHAIAKEEGLKYAYLGNVPGHPLEHTYCPECKSIAIERYGYSIGSWNLDKNNCCKKCGYPIPVIGKLNRSRRKNLFQIIQ
jgi:pyruvate formate lyase activating enzyme